MKKILIFLSFFLIASISRLSAQSDTPQSFNFYFIAQDVTTPTGKLIENLKMFYEDAISMKNPSIFYLSNGYEPIIVKVNFEDDNRIDFEDVLLRNIIVNNYHNVGGDIDYNNIVDLIASSGVVQKGYLNADLDIKFYVGKDFWDIGYNESIISAVYFTLDCHKYINNGLSFEVWSHEADAINNAHRIQKGKDEFMLFGSKNINGISNGFMVFDY
jgi:hypothetical protein